MFLSHREVWKRIAKGNPDEVYIIVEDDMIFEGELYDFNNIPDYDAVILWRHPSQMNTPVTYVKDGLLNFYNQLGTRAYAISPEFSNELISAIKELDTAIDLLLYIDFYPNRKVYITEKKSFYKFRIFKYWKF